MASQKETLHYRDDKTWAKCCKTLMVWSFWTRSCCKVTVVNNNMQWFKSDDGKNEAKSDFELHI